MSINPQKEELSDAIDMLHDRVISSIENFPDPPHRFTKDFMVFVGWDRKRYNQFYLERAKASRERSRAVDADPSLEASLTGHIPCITHKIWVTDLKNPKFPPEHFTIAYCKNIASFPNHWVHIIWSNSTEVHQHVLQYAEKFGASVLCCNINQLPRGRALEFVNRLIDAKKYVLSTDILRVFIINFIGGIYSDYGILFRTVMYGIAQRHEYCLVWVHDLHFQSSVIGAAAKSDLTTIFLAIISNPEALNREYAVGSKDTPLKAIDEVETFAGLGWTACIILFLPASVAQAYVYTGAEIEWHGLQSWYTEGGKLGNALIHHTPPTIVQDINYNGYETLAKKYIVQFQCINPVFKEKISVLVKTRDYFLEHSTRFGMLLHRYNLADETRLSGCSHLLNYLFWQYVDQRPSVLDLNGIDFDHPQDASRRCAFWTEYFRTAHFSFNQMHNENKLAIAIDRAGNQNLLQRLSDILDRIDGNGHYILSGMEMKHCEDIKDYLSKIHCSYVIVRNSVGGGPEDEMTLILEAPPHRGEDRPHGCATLNEGPKTRPETRLR